MLSCSLLWDSIGRFTSPDAYRFNRRTEPLSTPVEPKQQQQSLGHKLVFGSSQIQTKMIETSAHFQRDNGPHNAIVHTNHAPQVD